MGCMDTRCVLSSTAIIDKDKIALVLIVDEITGNEVKSYIYNPESYFALMGISFVGEYSDDYQTIRANRLHDEKIKNITEKIRFFKVDDETGMFIPYIYEGNPIYFFEDIKFGNLYVDYCMKKVKVFGTFVKLDFIDHFKSYETYKYDENSKIDIKKAMYGYIERNKEDQELYSDILNFSYKNFKIILPKQLGGQEEFISDYSLMRDYYDKIIKEKSEHRDEEWGDGWKEWHEKQTR